MRRSACYPVSDPKKSPTDSPTVSLGTLSRTKSLLPAGLKVWELKNGIRD